MVSYSDDGDYRVRVVGVVFLESLLIFSFSLSAERLIVKLCLKVVFVLCLLLWVALRQCVMLLYAGSCVGLGYINYYICWL